MKNPPHPGSFVRTEIIEPAELSVTAAAEVLGVTRAALSALLNERSALSPDMALRIEKAFGVSMDTLMRMQGSHDIAQATQTGRRDQGRSVPAGNAKWYTVQIDVVEAIEGSARWRPR